MTIEPWPLEGYRKFYAPGELEKMRAQAPANVVVELKQACSKCGERAVLEAVEGIGWLCERCRQSQK